MKAPFPWFGGKSQVAREVWDRFGHVPNYVEPFFGSGAVMLARPEPYGIETINDKDGFVANFWRALKNDPEAVAEWADNPVNECDLHARHLWLVNQIDDFTAHLCGDPDFYDVKIAGWWCWGLCCWIGNGWCSSNGPWQSVDGRMVLSNAGCGVNRQRPHLGDAGHGVNRKLPLYDWFTALANRLRNVRVCCGDWSRICGPTPTVCNGLTGVFLDPPYSHLERDSSLYRQEMSCADEVREWALSNGDNPMMRIALCGYAGEHEMPDSWECVAWKTLGGYANQGQQNNNRHRERIWFSPHCLRREHSLLDLIDEEKGTS